ncbi:hypothetical protein V5799_005450 [Amblyomma americanum]|uniref:Uncharacterized protein n=1 Tax=Amblyomma americanum TaxID=6943 RepID=A0AAQ4DZ77_AMBAM
MEATDVSDGEPASHSQQGTACETDDVDMPPNLSVPAKRAHDDRNGETIKDVDGNEETPLKTLQVLRPYFKPKPNVPPDRRTLLQRLRCSGGDASNTGPVSRSVTGNILESPSGYCDVHQNSARITDLLHDFL